MKIKDTVTLEDYEAMLQTHDWLYMYSEDKRKYDIGDYAHHNILKAAELSEAHLALYNQYKPIEKSKIHTALIEISMYAENECEAKQKINNFIRNNEMQILKIKLL